jgi:hypothetical protein
MKPSRAFLFFLLLVVALSLTATVGVAGEKCKSVRAHFGVGVYLGPDECPPYDGPATPNVPLACVVTPVAGTLNGTWILYWPTPDNSIVETPAELNGAIWRGGKQLFAFYALGVFDTRRGKVFTEIAEVTHSDSFSLPALAFADFEIVIGGTRKYEGATGWIAAFGDEADGGPMGGQICTPRSGWHGKK